MKICHVINDLSRGGAETHLYSLVKLQVEKGYNVTLLLLGKDQLNFVSLESQFNDLNLNLLRFKGPKKLQGINPFSIYKGISFFKKNKFDVIHTHTPRSDLLVYISNLFLSNKSKRIVTIHGKYGTYLQGNYFIDLLRKIFLKQQLKIWKTAFNVIVISESIKDWLRMLNPSINPLVIPYGIEVPPITNDNKLKTYTLGYLGKLNKNKGIEDLIDVYANLLKKENLNKLEPRLLIGGVGSEDYIKSLNKRINHKSIKFLGYVEDRYSFFNSIEIFIFPSYSEGLGLVLLEAMSHGVLCITRDVAPMNSIIQDGENGFLFKDNNELIEIIEKAFKLNSLEKDNIVKSALEKIEKSYSIMQMYLSIEKAYNK
tara:strand:+ start:1445 stop:2554 length:1110 start_codon:yes stop_codon:yes gene_type:complete